MDLYTTRSLLQMLEAWKRHRHATGAQPTDVHPYLAGVLLELKARRILDAKTSWLRRRILPLDSVIPPVVSGSPIYRWSLGTWALVIPFVLYLFSTTRSVQFPPDSIASPVIPGSSIYVFDKSVHASMLDEDTLVTMESSWVQHLV